MKACYFQGIEILRISGLKLLSLTMARWIEDEFYKVEISVIGILDEYWKKRKEKASSPFVHISWGPYDAEFVTLIYIRIITFIVLKPGLSRLIIYFLN